MVWKSEQLLAKICKERKICSKIGNVLQHVFRWKPVLSSKLPQLSHLSLHGLYFNQLYIVTLGLVRNRIDGRLNKAVHPVVCMCPIPERHQNFAILGYSILCDFPYLTFDHATSDVTVNQFDSLSNHRSMSTNCPVREHV